MDAGGNEPDAAAVPPTPGAVDVGRRRSVGRRRRRRLGAAAAGPRIQPVARQPAVLLFALRCVLDGLVHCLLFFVGSSDHPGVRQPLVSGGGGVQGSAMLILDVFFFIIMKNSFILLIYWWFLKPRGPPALGSGGVQGSAMLILDVFLLL